MTRPLALNNGTRGSGVITQFTRQNEGLDTKLNKIRLESEPYAGGKLAGALKKGIQGRLVRYMEEEGEIEAETGLTTGGQDSF